MPTMTGHQLANELTARHDSLSPPDLCIAKFSREPQRVGHSSEEALLAARIADSDTPRARLLADVTHRSLARNVNG